MDLFLQPLKRLSKAGLKIEDIGAFEVNEAFAVQVLAFLDHFGIADDDPRVNPYGGAIAVGPSPCILWSAFNAQLGTHL